MVYQRIVRRSLAGFAGMVGIHLAYRAGFPAKFGVNKERVKQFESIAMTIRNASYRDLTTEITASTVIYPGDPPFSKTPVCELGKDGSCFNLHQMHIGNHTGTHIDFPAHVHAGGKESHHYDINELIGEGIIIEVPRGVRSITPEFVRQQSGIFPQAFVFFKTDNSDISKQSSMQNTYVYIEPEAAKALLEKKVRVVGIDYISVDRIEAEELPVHKLLLGNNVLIVENLELGGVDPGKCQIHIIPPNIPGMDGLPARVFMKR